MSFLALNTLFCAIPIIVVTISFVISYRILKLNLFSRKWLLGLVVGLVIGVVGVIVGNAIFNALRESSPSGKWYMETNALGDQLVRLYGEQPTAFSLLYTENRPQLLLRCSGKELEAFVNVQQPLGGNFSRVKFDQTDVIELSMSTSASGEGLFFPDPYGAIQTMLNSETLTFQFLNSDGYSSVVPFDLRGLKSAIANLQSACQWPA